MSVNAPDLQSFVDVIDRAARALGTVTLNAVAGGYGVAVQGGQNNSSIAAGSSAVANGTVLDNSTPKSNHTLVAVASAGVTAGTVQLQASLDNVNFITIGTLNLTAAGPVSVSVANSPFRYIRAAITTAITGGTVQGQVASST